jgi:hypothetical protein
MAKLFYLNFFGDTCSILSLYSVLSIESSDFNGQDWKQANTEIKLLKKMGFAFNLVVYVLKE